MKWRLLNFKQHDVHFLTIAIPKDINSNRRNTTWWIKYMLCMLSKLNYVEFMLLGGVRLFMHYHAVRLVKSLWFHESLFLFLCNNAQNNVRPGGAESTGCNWWAAHFACSWAAAYCHCSPSWEWQTTGYLCCAYFSHLRNSERWTESIITEGDILYTEFVFNCLLWSL